MDVCKCIVPSRHEGTLNSRRAASLMRLMKGRKRWKDPDNPRVSFLKIGLETGQIMLSPICCSKLRITTGVTYIYPFAMMNFMDLELAFADQVALVTRQNLSAS
ncbi:uncharacterized protein TNCV_3838491 [Trichonephila clavipes]|nr:uncharacterized protein TNCV_3838491 [Trichonephila clavipes]